MNILITAATSTEIQPVIDLLQVQKSRIQNNECSTLITGIGGIATAYHLTKIAGKQKPDYIIQAGVAGSFHGKFPVGSVVCVQEELMGDLGVEEEKRFKDVFDLGLIIENEHPFSGKTLRNPSDGKIKYGLPWVRSISVNEITTSRERMELLQDKFEPDIESMEGAAFHYVCLQEKIPFLQVRAISNFVGERNKDRWNLKTAIENLNEKIIEIIHTLH